MYKGTTDSPVTTENKNQAMDQDFSQFYCKVRSKVHPRVNLPVFKKNRNKKIKVFSVESKDRKQRWLKMQRNFKEKYQNHFNLGVDNKRIKVDRHFINQSQK